MLTFCLFVLAGLTLICGAQVEELEEQQRTELAALSTSVRLARGVFQLFPL